MTDEQVLFKIMDFCTHNMMVLWVQTCKSIKNFIQKYYNEFFQLDKKKSLYENLIHFINTKNVFGVKYLIPKAIDVNKVKLRNISLQINAFKSENLEIISHLEKWGMKLDKPIHSQWIQICHHGQTEILQFLASKGFDLHIEQESPLQIAVQCGHIEMVRYLLSQNCNIHVNDEQILLMACEKGDLEIVKLLVSYGADIRFNNDAPLVHACISKNWKLFHYLVKCGANIHSNDEKALKMACKHNVMSIVSYLITNGANICIKNHRALRASCKYNHLEMVKFLISIYQSRNEIHLIPQLLLLKISSQKGHLDVVKYLISQFSYPVESIQEGLWSAFQFHKENTFLFLLTRIRTVE